MNSSSLILPPQEIIKPNNLSRRSFLRFMGITTVTAVVTPKLLLAGDPRYDFWKIWPESHHWGALWGAPPPAGTEPTMVAFDRLTGMFLPISNEQKVRLNCATMRGDDLLLQRPARPNVSPHVQEIERFFHDVLPVPRSAKNPDLTADERFSVAPGIFDDSGKLRPEMDQLTLRRLF